MKTPFEKLYDEILECKNIRAVYAHLQVCRHLYFKLEKKEIIDAFIAGYELNNSINMSEQLAEHYYNSIYNPNSFEKTDERGQKIK